jgi:hypothetical protein
MSVMKQFLKKSGPLAMTVVAGLSMADMANAQVRPDNGGTPVGTCNGQPCEPVTPTTPGTTVTTGDVTNTATGGNATNTTDVNVNNSATGGNAVVGDTTATGGNAVVGDTTATVGDTTSTATANNGGQSLNNTITHEAGAATAIAPTAVATASSNVTCGEQIGFSIGVAVVGFGASAGANLPAGVNAECMTNVRATTIIGAGVAIYGANQVAGADTIAVGIGVMMQADETVNQAARHVADMNCGSSNPLDPFRADCGRGSAQVIYKRGPAYK